MTKQARSKFIEYLWKFLVGVGVVITTTILISGGREYGDFKRAVNGYPEIKKDVGNIKCWMEAKDSVETVRYIMDTMQQGNIMKEVKRVGNEVEKLKETRDFPHPKFPGQ